MTTLRTKTAPRLRPVTPVPAFLRAEDKLVTIRRLQDALENLEIQAVRDVAPGWVSVPDVEWDSIFLHANREHT